MLRLVALLALMVCFATVRARAVGADDLFITVYNQIQQADAHAEAGRQGDAYAAYVKAQEDLRQLQRQYPTWNERVINYRLRYVAEKVEATKGFAAKPGEAKAKPLVPGGPVELAPSGEVISQFNSLNEQIQRLNSEKGMLEAKLREALSAQPAPVDPRQLRDAVEKISTLQQTNKVLLAKLEEQEQERKNLVDKVVAEEAQKALNEANRQLLEQRMALGRVEKSKAEVEAQLKSLQEGPLKKLEGENTSLKQQVSELKSDTEKGRQVADLAGKLSRLQTQFDDLKKQNDSLAAEKAALEKHLGDINVRKAEESIVRVAKLETDLALAQADAIRNSQKAEALAAALIQAKAASTQLEEQNKSLEDRVAGLTKENTTASVTVKRLQDALNVEKMERQHLEEKLKATEQQLASLASDAVKEDAANPAAPGTPPSAVAVSAAKALERASLLDAEFKNLRAALRESQEREAEVKTLLVEEQAMRTRLQRERVEIDRKLALLMAASTNTPVAASIAVVPGKAQPATPAAQVTASLEKRVKELESERESLQRRLVAAGVRLETQMLYVRPHTLTPREHAADLRLRR